jgi:transposase
MSNENDISKAGRAKRVYTKEFKEEICRLVSEGQKVKDLVGKYEIHESVIRKWIYASKNEGADAFRGKGNRAEIEDENFRLKKENQELRLEREILKKAAAYFAKHQS